jgi:mannitol/fructose-specific phosphotransferase system IIA component (Ntr-type)
VEFDSGSGGLTHLIMLIITPDSQTQMELLGETGRLFRREETVQGALAAQSFVELMAAINAPVAE